MPPLLLLLSPVWLVAEIVQLILAERLLGIARVKLGDDPRPHSPSPRTAALWSCTLITYWLWMLVSLTTGVGKTQLLALIVISIAGYLARRSSPLKAVIVLMTLEGALRIGMLLSLCILLWKRL